MCVYGRGSVPGNDSVYTRGYYCYENLALRDVFQRRNERVTIQLWLTRSCARRANCVQEGAKPATRNSREFDARQRDNHLKSLCVLFHMYNRVRMLHIVVSRN